MKFKIGDKVRNTEGFDVDGFNIPVGIDGVVIDIPCAGVVDVRWESPINEAWCQIEEELELIE